MKIKISNPYDLCLIFLLSFGIYASFIRVIVNSTSLVYLICHFAVISSIMILTPYVLNQSNTTRINLKNSIISGLILFLILDPSQKLSTTIIICVISLTLRLIFRYKFQPIINPAISGILVFTLISYTNILPNFKIFTSWWGVSFTPRLTEANISIAGIATLIIGIYLAYKTKRLYTALTGLLGAIIGFALISYLMQLTLVDYLFTLLEGTLLFAIFIMLSEPKTSPMNKSHQILYALTFVIVWMYFYYNNVTGGLILAIISANIVNLFIKFIPHLTLQDSLKIGNKFHPN